MKSICIVGGGLSGVECAYTLAKYQPVTLIEMRPTSSSQAHKTSLLGELVCSNSLRAIGTDNAVGILKEEMRSLGSLVMESADANQIPAGKALAVDRECFASYITEKIKKKANITFINKEITSIQELTQEYSMAVLATGPLSSEALTAELSSLVGEEHLYFYDAIAPIINVDSVDMTSAFWASRYQKEGEEGEYINCPMNEEEYNIFYTALLEGNKVPTNNAEKNIHFEGCMPIESLAERGIQTLLFGSLKPVGIIDPKTGKRPFAVVQLRLENHNKTTCNLVGCQTRLTYPEQKRIFKLIPALRHAEFVRFGSVHRNTYIHSPTALNTTLAVQNNPSIFCTGQLIGVEGYAESASMGLWLGHFLGTLLHGTKILPPPPTTSMGALLAHVTREVKNFQPSNVTFGLMPEITDIRKKTLRRERYATRAMEDFAQWNASVSKFLQI